MLWWWREDLLPLIHVISMWIGSNWIVQWIYVPTSWWLSIAACSCQHGVCMYIRMYVRTYVHVCVHTYLCIHVRTYVRMYSTLGCNPWGGTAQGILKCSDVCFVWAVRNKVKWISKLFVIEFKCAIELIWGRKTIQCCGSMIHLRYVRTSHSLLKCYNDSVQLWVPSCPIPQQCVVHLVCIYVCPCILTIIRTTRTYVRTYVPTVRIYCTYTQQ